jgi:cytochrome c biogenesis protein CcmG/thiol:disulfide interchange protein DsbE
MIKKFFPSISIIFFVIIFFVFYKGLQNSNIYTPSVVLNKEIPFFKTKSLNNDLLISDQIFKEKKFYLMNIWSSWCMPCRDEHPFLMSLSEQKNLEIIGLNYKDTNDKAQGFLTELDNPYDTVILDNDGIIAIEWGAYGVPESFLIYDKKIIKKIIGPLN